jgi:hypothetical protein
VIKQRDMGLPDMPAVRSGTGPIAAIETDSVATFARDLRVLRSQVGLDYSDMAEQSHYTMRTLASAAGGLRLPTLPVLIAYVNTCGGDMSEWEERWHKLSKTGKPTDEVAVSNPQYALPGQGDFGSQGGPGPGGPAGGQAPPSNQIYVITSAPERDEW